jgi:Na+-driven multidrug efflux pump
MRKYAAFVLLLLVGMFFATTVLYTVQLAVSQLCVSLKSLLPVIAMMMLIMAGVIYAAGQILGAETRARANVWATACLTGALIAILIVVIAQPVLQTMLGVDNGTVACEPE